MCDPLKGIVCPHKRGRQPIRTVNESITKTASNTEFSPVHRVFTIASGPHNVLSTHAKIESTAYTAVGAGRLYLPGWIFHLLGYQGRYRTTFNAFPARYTNRVLERLVTKGANLKLITPISHVNGMNAYNFAAGTNAYAALDALVGIEVKKGIAGVNWKVLCHAI
jgi:hypothetical protein